MSCINFNVFPSRIRVADLSRKSESESGRESESPLLGPCAACRGAHTSVLRFRWCLSA